MVSVRGVSKSFGDRPVLTGIDLEVPAGQLLAIMGSSGGGKTTLLRCISGLIQPTNGDVVVDEIDVRKKPDEARRHMGMVFQSAALFDEVAARCSIQSHCYVGQLSSVKGDSLSLRTWVTLQSSGRFSGRQRRSFVPWRKRFPEK